MNLREVETFLRVVSEGSYSQAALSLDITQPTVTARIANLERHFGQRLFERRGNRSHLTSAGQALLPYAEQMLSTALQAQSSLDSDEIGEQAQVLRIGCNTTASCAVVPEAIRRFRTTNPFTPISLEVNRTVGLMPLLMDSTIEVAFVNPQLSHYLAQSLFDRYCRSVLVTHPDNAVAGTTVDAAALLEQPFVTYTFGPAEQEMRRISSMLGERLTTVFETNSVFVVRALIKDGMGMSFLPEDAVAGELARGALSQVKIEGFDPQPWRMSLVRWRRKALSPAAAAFVRAARATRQEPSGRHGTQFSGDVEISAMD